MAEQDIRLLRPAREGEPERPGAPLCKPLPQVIESVNETFKGQLNLEQHRGRTPGGVIARVVQRILTLTAAVRHNDHTGRPVLRSLTAMTTGPLELTIWTGATGRRPGGADAWTRSRPRRSRRWPED